MNWRDIKRDARRDVHENMQVPALYLEPGQVPRCVSVRVHTKFEQLGDMRGTSFAFAERQEASPRIVFLREEVPAPARHAIVSVEPGEAYRIDNVLPADDITVTVEVLRVGEDEAQMLPVPR